MDCPVCQTPNDDQAFNCSKCNVDLVAFKHLNSVDQKIKKQKLIIVIVSIILIITALALAVIVVTSPGKSELKELQSENETIKLKNEELKNSLGEIEQQLDEIKKEPEQEEGGKQIVEEATSTTGEYKTHIIKKGDTLWELAFKYYKNPYKFEKIATDNNITDPKTLEIGQELKIY